MVGALVPDAAVTLLILTFQLFDACSLGNLCDLCLLSFSRCGCALAFDAAATYYTVTDGSSCVPGPNVAGPFSSLIDAKPALDAIAAADNTLRPSYVLCARLNCAPPSAGITVTALDTNIDGGMRSFTAHSPPQPNADFPQIAVITSANTDAAGSNYTQVVVVYSLELQSKVFPATARQEIRLTAAVGGSTTDIKSCHSPAPSLEHSTLAFCHLRVVCIWTLAHFATFLYLWIRVL